MDTLLSMKVFRAVAEHRSFAAAAERLGLSPAMVSKHVMHLERRLSTRLLNRTSRHVGLTESGALYFEQVRAMLDELGDVETAISRTTVKPRGVLKLSAPVWMANGPFVQILADYQVRYPEVTFDVDLSDRQVHLINEGFDLALRVSRDPGEGLAVRPLSAFSFGLVASPAYLQRAGRPTTVDELAGHAFLAYSLLPFDPSAPVAVKHGPVTVKLATPLRSGNETLLHLAALAGMGLTYLPNWLVEPDLKEGRLERILPQEMGFQAPLFAVYPSRKYLSAKVRTFIDFIADDPRLS